MVFLMLAFYFWTNPVPDLNEDAYDWWQAQESIVRKSKGHLRAPSNEKPAQPLGPKSTLQGWSTHPINSQDATKTRLHFVRSVLEHMAQPFLALALHGHGEESWADVFIRLESTPKCRECLAPPGSLPMGPLGLQQPKRFVPIATLFCQRNNAPAK